VRSSNHQFAIRCQKRTDPRVRQNDLLKDGFHPGISPLYYETLNRFFGSTVHGEVGPEDLVLAKQKKKHPTTIRSVARAVALRFDPTVISIIRHR
jgi:hypothetical protein